MFKGLLFLLSDSRTPGFWLLLLLFFVPAAYSQNKTVPARKPAASSPFAEAQSLLQQGSIADAKARIQEQLALHPSSVEGYNLLGIACTNEKDYDGAWRRFIMP